MSVPDAKIIDKSGYMWDIDLKLGDALRLAKKPSVPDSIPVMYAKQLLIRSKEKLCIYPHP